MSKRLKRRLVPRFSLRVFLLGCFLLTISTAWFANEYSTYKNEQKLIESIVASTVKGAVEVTTNGNARFAVGGVFM